MKPHFDRLDICDAYAQLEADYNRDGWLRERPSNRRRMESCGVQIRRIGFQPCRRDELSDNARAIYNAAVRRLGLPR